MACTRFLRSVWIFGFCLGKFNYEVLRNQVGNLDIVFIGNVVINHLISDEELNIRSFRLRNVTTATRPTHQVYSIFSAHVGRPYCHTPFSPISEWKTEKWLNGTFLSLSHFSSITVREGYYSKSFRREEKTKIALKK